MKSGTRRLASRRLSSKGAACFRRRSSVPASFCFVSLRSGSFCFVGVRYASFVFVLLRYGSLWFVTLRLAYRRLSLRIAPYRAARPVYVADGAFGACFRGPFPVGLSEIRRLRSKTRMPVRRGRQNRHTALCNLTLDCSAGWGGIENKYSTFGGFGKGAILWALTPPAAAPGWHRRRCEWRLHSAARAPWRCRWGGRRCWSRPG